MAGKDQSGGSGQRGFGGPGKSVSDTLKDLWRRVTQVFSGKK
jgi:hypothetical protein